MTENVRTKAEELKTAVLDSEEYRNYDMYRRLLNETPELKARVNEFREANVLIQVGCEKRRFAEMQELADGYNDILTNSVAREFLNSELILCKMIQQLSAIILDDIELELDFL